MEVDDQLAGDGGGGAVSVVVGDESQRQVDPGGDAGVGVVEETALRPVGGRAPSVQQSGGGEHERTGTDRGDAARIGGEPPYLGKQLAVGDHCVHVGSASIRYSTAGRTREALEKTSSGPVTSRIWAVSNAGGYGSHLGLDRTRGTPVIVLSDVANDASDLGTQLLADRG